MQNNQNLISLIATLSPGEQAVVEEFIKTLKDRPRNKISFREALDEFKQRHPELLKLLAQ